MTRLKRYTHDDKLLRRVNRCLKAGVRIEGKTIRGLSHRTPDHSFFTITAELKKTLPGWKAYFDGSEILSPLRDAGKWIRRQLRYCRWKQWGSNGEVVVIVN